MNKLNDDDIVSFKDIDTMELFFPGVKSYMLNEMDKDDFQNAL